MGDVGKHTPILRFFKISEKAMVKVLSSTKFMLHGVYFLAVSVY